MKKLKIEFIRAEFKKEGYDLLTKIYDNNKQKLEYICKRGHRHNIAWSGWNSKGRQRCPYCVGTGKLTIEFIRAEFAKEDYILLTKIYKNAHQKLKYICPAGHHHSVTWNDWNSKKKHRCPYCVGNAKLNIEFIRAEFAKEGYILLTEIYEGVFQKLEYICPRGHGHSVSWSNWNSKNKSRCPFCNNIGVSKWEKMIKKFLVELNISHVPNDRTQLVNPETGYKLELDVWIPDSNKAIECNGVYWHKNRQHVDLIKKQLCKDQNIDLLVITDEEWKDDIDKCKTKIKNFVTGE
jgi:uncharacterized Zn-finger protein